MGKRTTSSEYLLPVKQENRNVGMLGFSFMWVGIAVTISTFALGGEGVKSLTLIWVILACFLANLVLGMFITLTGDIGIEHGVSFPVYMRAPFGVIGTHIPSISRGIVAAAWFGIQTYLGALAINYIVEYFTEFDNWFVWYVAFAALQILNTAFGIKAVEKFADIAAPAIIITCAWMYVRLEGVAAEAGRNIWTTTLDSSASVTGLSAFMLIFFTNMAYWSTLAADIPTLTRFVKAPAYEKNWWKRNKSLLVAHLVALPFTQTLLILIGGVSMIAIGNWNPVEAIQQSATGIVLVILLLLVIFAQWSTNSAGNLIPAAITFMNAGTPKVTYISGLILAGVVGSIIQPWQLMDTIITFLLLYGGILSAVSGILFADYYLLRKRRVNIPDLYKKHGQFYYAKGWNFAGILAWIGGGAAAYTFSTYSFIVGWVVGASLYYVLAKFWWFKRYKQVEIETNFPDEYLGITVGRDWVVDGDYDEKKLTTATGSEVI